VKKAFLPVTIFLLAFVSPGQICLGAAQQFKPGEIRDPIVCRESPGQSYALYLPSDYSPDRTWPVLYALDPGARGRLPLEHFRDAAEKYHYLIVGSNNARNGPWEPIINAVVAVWNDTQARLSIDRKRIYATGFSGGSRAAALFSKMIRSPVAGIIGCGAGLPPGIKPEDIQPAFYFGLVGREDFNHLEMMNLNTQFEEAGTPHRVLVFEGSHDWPSPEVCTRALAWMEFAAMTRGLRPPDQEMIREIYASEVAAAQALEMSGNILGAVSEYETLAAAFGREYDTGRL
jgi:dienelactone hydrolase